MNLPKNLEALESGRLAWSIAEAADDRKAENIVLLKVNEVSYLADFFVVATGFSRTQVRAIADAIEDKLEKEFERVPLRKEGHNDGTWVLQDYGEVIVHVFLPQEREFYNLEAFWGHAETIEYQPVSP
ncbi:ribosome silencing factor [[Limnothrix rosea] IAM M-220]|uniref:ribosome silencing factor n=1 Tax=[Limnothrix rosea] IAM M-220 TaxID=454133 RepID=UPI0009596B57|nr:ribosome silencing factor [[Limnothrix rosea] IAM M-220]OKH17295.1 ribosome silencing factor [[Limnothrix rosea] IAM M-220]